MISPPLDGPVPVQLAQWLDAQTASDGDAAGIVGSVKRWKRYLIGTTFTTTTNGLLSFGIEYSFKANFDVSGQLVSRFSALLPTLFETCQQANSSDCVNLLLD